MQLQHQEQPQEARYDLETLGKVTRLAQQLQSQDKDTWSAAEIESMGAEVGLQPEFIQKALGKLEEERRVTAPKPKQKASPEALKAWRNGWWAGGWTLPLVLLAIMNVLGFSEAIQGLAMLAGGPIWLGIGVYLSSLCKGLAPASGVASRDMIRTLKQYQVAPEPVTLLSIAPAVPIVDVQQSTPQLTWIRDTCRAYRSDGDTITGQSVEAVFRSPADAAAAARAVQERSSHMAAQDPLTPSLRCGLATGADLERARAEAAELVDVATPGDILTDVDSCGAALPVLDQLVELPGKVGGGNVYSWRATRT